MKNTRKKQKEIIVKNLYIGKINECVVLKKEENSRYVNSRFYMKTNLLEIDNNTFITEEAYLNDKKEFLSIEPSYEKELYVDKSSLIMCPIEELEKVKKLKIK